MSPGKETGSRLPNINHSWDRIGKLADLDGIRLRDSRRTFVSRSPALGGVLPMIGERQPRALTLPAAMRGDAPVSYSLSPALPAGLAFDPATRTLSGMPGAAAATATYTYTATDADGETASLSFTITVLSEPSAMPTDREVLVALYEATGGAGWTTGTNWLSAEPVGAWHGVTTDATGQVTGLNIRNNRLSGSLPSALGSLIGLRSLFLYGNAV